jgi:hypothetical protein
MYRVAMSAPLSMSDLYFLRSVGTFSAAELAELRVEAVAIAHGACEAISIGAQWSKATIMRKSSYR